MTLNFGPESTEIGLIQSQAAAAATEPRCELNALLTGTLSLSVVVGDDRQTDMFSLTCGHRRSQKQIPAVDTVEPESRRVQEIRSASSSTVKPSAAGFRWKNLLIHTLKGGRVWLMKSPGGCDLTTPLLRGLRQHQRAG